MQYGCIGRKLSHSFSKIIHNMLEDYDYQLCELEPQQLGEFFEKRDFKAINVTIPYKQDVIKYLDYTDSIALEIGAVNTIVNRGGRLYGYNTDFSGMSALIEKNGVSLKNKKVAILGSGGTSKTAFAVAKSMGADSVIRVSRSGKDRAVTYESLYTEYGDTEIVINTTPCGMYPEIDGAAADLSKLPCVTAVFDAVYNPLRSQLVMTALEKGLVAEGGLYMLVAQAVFAAEHFTGKSYPKGEIDRIFGAVLKQKENIVLIGMPGCGKSTLGKSLSQKLGREFFDTDSLIVQKHGEIKKIFERAGETGFRDIESEAVNELAAKGGVIIATGGGAVLREQNVRYLKQNGCLVFLDRDIEGIEATDDRPLSNDRQKLLALYEVRLPIYKKAADIEIKVTDDVAANTGKIEDGYFNS